jgi:REase_DpnII-MboI/Queuosine biosynthesis protein QueC
LFIYENGITALNFARRQDLLKARASRTTHPKTIRLLNNFLSEVSGDKFKIHSPFASMTKGDVLKKLADLNQQRLVSSAVSCSKTFQKMKRVATQCGMCSQCVERRFAAYAAELDSVDEAGLYATDFIEEAIELEGKTVLLDFVRQAKEFADYSIDQFYADRNAELVEMLDGLSPMSEQAGVQKVWELCRRHGEQVLFAITRMRETHDNPYHPVPQGSFLQMVSEREYLKEPRNRLIETLRKKLITAIPLTFQRNKPKDENDFNDKVSALLRSDREEIEREHPAVRFALAHAVPDHSAVRCDVFIESKYVRGATTPAKANEGMAADLTKYCKRHYVLFIVYDPERSISDDGAFKGDFEKTGQCAVLIIR